MRGARRATMVRVRHGAPGDMARQMDIFRIGRPEQPRPSLPVIPVPSPQHNGRPSLLRIVKQDEGPQDQLDTSTLQVQFVWMDREQTLDVENPVREIIQNIRAKPVIRTYLSTATMEQVVRDCQELFKPQDVKIVLLADGTIVDAQDTFSQLVSARRLVVSNAPESDVKFYTLQIRLQDPPAPPPSSSPAKSVRSVSTSPLRVAEPPVNSVDRGGKRRGSPGRQSRGKRRRVEEEPLPAPVEVGSLQELLEPIMGLGVIKKLTLNMEMEDGEIIILTADM